MAPLCKISALRMLMTGKAKKYVDLWEADHDLTIAKKTYEELMNKATDYARRRKFDTTAKKTMQQGGDPMHGGAIGGLSWEDYDQDGVYAKGFKGESKAMEENK